MLDWQRHQPVRCARDASLHRRAVRPEHAAAALRLRLLHPPLRRRGRRLTTTERGDTDDERIRHTARAAELGRPDAGARTGRRQPDREVAPRRRDRGRDPGHEQARAVDPRLRIPVPRLHRRAPTGLHAAVELRVQPGRARPRLRLLDHRDRPERRVPDLRLPRHHALRRDHAAELRHDEPGAHGRGHARSRRPTISTSVDARRRRLLQRGAQRGAAGRPRRRLVGARPTDPPAPDAQVLVRLDPRDRRARRDRTPRRPRRRHDTGGDRATLLGHGRRGSRG